MSPRKIALLCLFCLIGGACFCTDSAVVTITIESSWGGLGPASKGMLTISGHNGKFKANGKRVDAKRVQKLLSTLNDPTVDSPTLANCGIDERWLTNNYARALQEYTHESVSSFSAKQIDFFKRHFTDAGEAQRTFAEMFKGWHTDDFPEMSVTVSDGHQSYGVRSSSQHPFMLPWAGTDRPRGGYNCEIGQAVADLVPKGFSNRRRLLTDTGFRWDYTEQLMRDNEHDWNLLVTESKIGTQIAPVLAHFSIIKSAITNLYSIDLNGARAWNAELRSNELPPNLIAGVSLQYSKQKELAGISDFVERFGPYANLVLSVPWLSRYLHENPSAVFELRYVDERSLSPKARTSLIQDLTQHGKASLAEMVATNAENSAFLEIENNGCGSRAIVLPTKEVVLWHFKCDSVLGFDAKKFVTWDYYNWRSTGALIEPDGTIAP